MHGTRRQVSRGACPPTALEGAPSLTVQHSPGSPQLTPPFPLLCRDSLVDVWEDWSRMGEAKQAMLYHACISANVSLAEAKSMLRMLSTSCSTYSKLLTNNGYPLFSCLCHHTSLKPVTASCYPVGSDAPPAKKSPTPSICASARHTTPRRLIFSNDLTSSLLSSSSLS